MPAKRRWLALALFALWLGQWAYLALVGLPSGLWDVNYTHAEKKLGKRFPYPPESLDGFRQAARLAEQLDPEDGRLGRSYHDLGALLYFMGQNNEARLYLTRSLQIFERVDGPQSTWAGIARGRLGELQMRTGKSSEALANLQRADAILLRTVGRLDPMALRIGFLLALQAHDREKAKFVLESYRLAGVVPDAAVRLQLEQMLR
ncbi:MAG: tetratricopeptide repeat protein [Vulcanimicrobiota bacterium]